MTIQVVLQPASHALQNTAEHPYREASRFAQGDIVAVYRTDQFATLVGQEWKWKTDILSPRCGFIHMPGVPSENTAKMRRRFMEDLTENNRGRLDEDQPDVPLTRHRRWRVHLDKVPQRVRDDLQTFKESTYPWDNIKPYIRKKVFTDPTDASQDDESQPVDEGDIPPDPVPP